MKLTLLILAFAVTAALYASVGFGGGSTYTALLVLTGTEFYLIPLISLMCNITVVSSNAVRYSREKLVPWRRLLPLITFSIPAAWLGGRLVVSETLFIGLLWVSLLIAGVRLLRRHAEPQKSPKSLPVWGLACMGAAIGLLSGIVGIGGGIFLAPVLHAVNWGKARVIAASCSVFILVNSLAGLWGQSLKLASLQSLTDALPYWPLIPAVLLGGFIGNHIGVFRLSERVVKRATAILILFVALRLAWRWFGLVA